MLGIKIFWMCCAATLSIIFLSNLSDNFNNNLVLMIGAAGFGIAGAIIAASLENN